jgi:RNA polymerase sigma-70 factor (ECF subfamily)
MQKSGSAQFDALIAPHLERLFRVAYRLVRNTSDAQDLVQDTCLAACENLNQIAATDSPLRWLLRVQHNRFIDNHRRHHRSPVVGVADMEDGVDPEDLAQQAQDEEALERAFLLLDEMPRMLLSLRAEGYDLPEIEAITGIDRKLLSARLHRARVGLALHLKETNSTTASHHGARRKP